MDLRKERIMPVPLSSYHVLAFNRHWVYMCWKITVKCLFFPKLAIFRNWYKKAEFLILLDNARMIFLFLPSDLRIIKRFCLQPVRWPPNAWNRACFISFLLLRVSQLQFQNYISEEKCSFTVYTIWTSS